MKEMASEKRLLRKKRIGKKTTTITWIFRTSKNKVTNNSKRRRRRKWGIYKSARLGCPGNHTKVLRCKK